MVLGLVSRLPISLFMKFGFATLFRPRTRGWAAASAAIEEYVEEREAAARRALHLDAQGAE
jgi:heterodisulfide reductase subunit C